MNTKLILLPGAASLAAAFFWIAWSAAGPQKGSQELTQTSGGSNVLKHRPLASMPRTDRSALVESESVEGNLERRFSAASLQHHLSVATLAEARELLRKVEESERRAPGSAASELAPEGVTLSFEVIMAYAMALLSQDRLALPESMDSALRKVLLRGDHSLQAGQALVELWKQNPSPENRASIEGLGNPWFYAATAAHGWHVSDQQLVQESLAGLETAAHFDAVPALISMARAQTADYNDVAETLYHWAVRHRDLPDVTHHILDTLVGASEPAIQSLAAVAVAGSGNPEQARATLLKLQQQFPSSHRAQIDYALSLVAGGRS